ncbi:MAG TPA: low molecular weight phosphatase family protein [Ruminococcaceae bacterium]|nr:low molecular weight phosphatase family protein [Oscillospiraceae bacterium]
MKSYLFVCTGNTCRSPMAEVIFNDLLKKRGLHPTASSAGIMGWPGQSASQNAIEAMREIGLDLSKHRARLLTQEMLGSYDQIYVMSASHLSALQQTASEFLDKIQILGDGIEDPYGQNMRVYRECRDQIFRTLRALVEKEL